MSNIVENWLFTLSNNNSGFVRLAFSDVTYNNNFYHGAILNRPTISESINLDQSTSTTSSITLEVAEFQYSSLKMSQELYGGTNSYINQQIQVDLLVNGSATTVGKFRINDISYDGFKITLSCSSAMPWDFVTVPQDEDTAGVLIPLAYGNFNSFQAFTKYTNPRFVHFGVNHTYRKIPYSPVVKDEINPLVATTLPLQFYILGYNESEISENTGQTTSYFYDEGADVMIPLLVSSDLSDAVNSDKRSFSNTINSRTVYYDMADASSADGKTRGTRAFKFKPKTVRRLLGATGVSNLSNCIDNELETNSFLIKNDPHTTNHALIQFPNMNSLSSGSSNLALKRCILKFQMPNFEGSISSDGMKFQIFYSHGISVADTNLTQNVPNIISYKWSDTDPSDTSATGFTEIREFSVSPRQVSESNIQVNDVGNTSNENNIDFITISNPDKAKNLYIRLATAPQSDGGHELTGYTAFFKIHDVRVVTSLEDNRDDPRAFLYTGADGEKETYSGSSTTIDTAPEAHRQALINFTNMSTSTPEGWSDLNTARANWKVAYSTTKQVTLKSLLEKLQKEHGFIFRYKQGDINQPQYLFVKDSYSSSEITELSKNDINNVKMKVLSYNQLVTKLIINYHKNPANSKYAEQTTAEISGIRTALNIQSKENIKTINLDTLVSYQGATIIQNGTTPNDSYANYYMNIFGQPKLIIDFNIVNPNFNSLEVGNIIKFNNSNMFPETPLGDNSSSWSNINFMITKTRRTVGLMSITAREV